MDHLKTCLTENILFKDFPTRPKFLKTPGQNPPGLEVKPQNYITSTIYVLVSNLEVSRYLETNLEKKLLCIRFSLIYLCQQ